MKLANTTEGLMRLLKDDVERVRVMHECGFQNIDLSLYDGCRPDWEYVGEGWEARVHALRESAEGLGVRFVQSHAPGCNPLDEKEFDLALERTSRAIEICRILGIPNTVYHAGFEIGIGREEFLRRNRVFVEKLLPVLEKNGVTLCIENTTKRHYEGYYYFCDGESMRDFVEEIGHPLFAACWDTGHANIDGDQYRHIMALGKHLKALHFNDNLGFCDQHLPPWAGTLNIDEVMHALIDVGYEGYLTFESSNGVIFHDNWLFARRTFEEDTRALDPSLAVMRKLIELTYTIGEDILSRYQLLEK